MLALAIVLFLGQKLTEKAYLLLALASAGHAPLEDLNQVYRYRDGLGPFSLATLALALRGRAATSA